MTEIARIVAIKGDPERPSIQYDSLRNGEGRFGWSTSPTVDLNALRAKIDNADWSSLSDEQKESYSYGAFLLGLRANDYVVYINVPQWGQCTVARVTTPYVFRFDCDDFNHRFGVARESIRTFDRNDAIVHPHLSARLKLRGASWEIYARDEFEQLLQALSGCEIPPRVREQRDNLNYLLREIRPLLETITKRIQHTHPNYDFERFVELILQSMPNVREVIRQGGAGDHGADLLVTYASGFPVPWLQSDETCVVQCKSFVGEHWDTQAVDDIRRAFDRYPQASCGLIVSTADRSSPALDAKLEQLKQDTGKTVYLLIGPDVASLFLRFHNVSSSTNLSSETTLARVILA